MIAFSDMRIAMVQQHAGMRQAENVARGLRAFEAAARAGAQVVGFAELAFEPFYPQNPAGPESLRRRSRCPARSSTRSPPRRASSASSAC